MRFKGRDRRPARWRHAPRLQQCSSPSSPEPSKSCPRLSPTGPNSPRLQISSTRRRPGRQADDAAIGFRPRSAVAAVASTSTLWSRRRRVCFAPRSAWRPRSPRCWRMTCRWRWPIPVSSRPHPEALRSSRATPCRKAAKWFSDEALQHRTGRHGRGQAPDVVVIAIMPAATTSRARIRTASRRSRDSGDSSSDPAATSGSCVRSATARWPSSCCRRLIQDSRIRSSRDANHDARADGDRTRHDRARRRFMTRDG